MSSKRCFATRPLSRIFFSWGPVKPIKNPCGIRRVVRRQLHLFPEAVQTVVQVAHALHRPVTDVSTEKIVSWAAMRAFC
jgi:hypothetical protein